jgi:hypothetical protein
MTKCLLLVEGQPGLLLNLTDRLAGEGWEMASPGGADAVRELKQRGIDVRGTDVPILMLKPRQESTRPQAPLAKTPGVHQIGSLRVDLGKARVERDGVEVTIPGKQFQLLRYFLEHPGKTITREELLDAVWGHSGRRSTRTVDVHVAWLRKKLEPNPRFPRYISTIYGMGYRFLPVAEDGLSRGAGSPSVRRR